MVSQLVMKAKRNPKYIHDLMIKRDEEKQHREDIAEVVSEMNKYDVVIDSVVAVQKGLKEGYDMEAKTKTIRSVMKQELGMRYRKIVSVSTTGNTPKNLVLRQQFALKLIEVLEIGKTVINVDET